ncbi:MAG: dihydrofolate reductase FolA [Candidatus Parcubacteria bacterium]|jgi:dihydrofolate reductase
MNVFIIASLTSDGFIAKDSNQISVSWTSKEDKQRFVRLSKEARVIVMGSKTFATMPKPLKERLNIVYTRDPEKAHASQTETFDNLEFTNVEPAELIQSLEQRGYTSVAICGGSEIYTKFIESGLVTKLYITYEPILFGSGITLFNKPLHQALELVSLEKTETGTLFAEYNLSSVQ